MAAQQRQTLENLPSGRGMTVYELAQAACVDGSCPFELRLLRAGIPQGESLALAWPAQAPAALVEADAGHGTGTPLRPAALRARVWSAGEEEATVTVSARTLDLPGAAAGAQALLVTQMAGFEHLKRRHALYVASASGPRLAWSYEEPPGPVSSWVLASPGRAPVLLVRQGALSDGGAERVQARSLRWHAGRQVFTATAAPAPAALLAVVAGRHAGVAAAQAARLRHGDCLAAYAVVQARQAGRAPRHALIQVAADAAEARAETRRLLACGGGLRPRTVPLARLLPDPPR